MNVSKIGLLNMACVIKFGSLVSFGFIEEFYFEEVNCFIHYGSIPVFGITTLREIQIVR